MTTDREKLSALVNRSLIDAHREWIPFVRALMDENDALKKRVKDLERKFDEFDVSVCGFPISPTSLARKPEAEKALTDAVLRGDLDDLAEEDPNESAHKVSESVDPVEAFQARRRKANPDRIATLTHVCKLPSCDNLCKKDYCCRGHYHEHVRLKNRGLG